MKTSQFIHSAILLLLAALPISIIASPANPHSSAASTTSWPHSEARRGLTRPSSTATPSWPQSDVLLDATPTPSAQYNTKEDARLVKKDNVNNAWAGLMHTALPAGTTGAYTLVQADFRVPTPSPPPGTGSGTWSGQISLGIDDVFTQSVGLLASVEWTVARAPDNTLTHTYSLSYWYSPSESSTISNFPISAGDMLFISVRRISPTEGQVVFVNTSTKQKTTIHVPGSEELPGRTVQWVVSPTEGFHLPSFGQIEFLSCLAQTTEKYIGLGGTEVGVLNPDGEGVLTSVVKRSASDFTVSYIAT